MTASIDYLPTVGNRRQNLISELQTHGLQLLDGMAVASSRRGGAGPSDHKATNVLGTTVMVPIHTKGAGESAYAARLKSDGREAVLYHDGRRIGTLTFPPEPRFYGLKTSDGIPYWKIAQLHARDVLATTVLQTCIRYGDKRTSCQFCAIGESLKTGRTITEKTPSQLAEVAAAAQLLDGVKHMVMTTGTPATPDRGARVLRDAARMVFERTRLPIQVQCEPPDDFSWFTELHHAGVVAVGMHLEAINPVVRANIMPGKAEVPFSYYLKAYKVAVAVFGRGQVSTYLLAGLGDSKEGLLEGCRQLIELGVYPFVVPFVPNSGTPMAGHPPPTASFMRSVLEPLGRMIGEAGITAAMQKAGCGKCGACSPLSTYET